MPKPSSSSLPIEKINALAELERVGWSVTPLNDSEVGMKCPVHEDSNPSVNLNVKKNLWKCRSASCGVKGDIVSLLAYILQADRATVLTDLSTRYELQQVKAISPEIVERFHSLIWSAGPLLTSLRDRGISDVMIRSARLGFHDNRITIPVYDMERRVINIRRYLPGAPGQLKMFNTKGYGTPPTVYQVEQTKYEKVWICGGEMKALVVGAMLNKHTIGATAVTAGEGAWERSFNALFKGKIVYLCMDIDLGGRIAARKLAQELINFAKEVYIIQLPLDQDRFPKGDVNDYVGQTGAGDDDLLRVMAEAVKFEPSMLLDETDKTSEVHTIKLADASKSFYMGKRIAVDAVVQAMDTTPYLIPRVVDIQCTKDQPNCSWCPVFSTEPSEKTGMVRLTVRGTAVALLDIVQQGKAKMREATREALGIPSCKACEFTHREHTNAYDVRLMPQLETSGSNSDCVVQPAWLIGSHKIETNTPYIFSGRVYPHPNTQQAILMFDDVSQSKSSLDSFNPNDTELEQLRVFQAKGTIRDKLHDIYNDLEANVTRIYHRRELHLIIDLVFHSVLYFSFDDKQERGWVNAVIVGDSSQGKSEASQRLLEHYRLGERLDCKNATVAGVLGGCEQVNNHWFVSWGTIPIHDRRLVILEELKGAPLEVVSKLTDMRTSGIAEIHKIERRRAHARTRLLFISNPRGVRAISAYSFGCETIEELMGGKEDVRRCDVAVVLSSRQINSEEINKLVRSRPRVSQVFTSELCNRLVLWAWTRKQDQVVFEDGAVQACMDEANRLATKFTDELPLIDKGTTKHKLARLAAGLAARLFSTTDLRTLLVTKEHVEFVSQMIDRWYSDKHFGYLDYSLAVQYKLSIQDPTVVRAHILNTKHPKDLVNGLLNKADISMSDFQDWCDLDRDGAQHLLSLFVRKHALNREKRWYVKSSGFIALLKLMSQENLPTTAMTKEEY